MSITRQQVEAANSYRRLVAKGFDSATAIQVATEEHGVSAEQLKQLLADVRDLPEESFQKAKRDFLRASELHISSGQRSSTQSQGIAPGKSL
jgi:hypothetical protein